MQRLESERLILRGFTEADTGDLFLYAADPDVGPRAGWKPHESREESLSIIGVYLALYLLIGSGSVVENTYLNRLAPAESRASILSLFSLVLQIGGVCASLVGYLVSANAAFQQVWLLAGVALLLFILVTAFLKKRAEMPAAAVSPEPNAARQDA